MAKKKSSKKIDSDGDVIVHRPFGSPTPIDPYEAHPSRIEALEKQVDELQSLVRELVKKVSHLGAQTPTGGTIPLNRLQVAACIEADSNAKFMVLAAWEWNGYRESQDAIMLAREVKDLPRFVNKGLKLSLVVPE